VGLTLLDLIWLTLCVVIAATFYYGGYRDGWKKGVADYKRRQAIMMYSKFNQRWRKS
jgi:hypothetical protein